MVSGTRHGNDRHHGSNGHRASEHDPSYHSRRQFSARAGANGSTRADTDDASTHTRTRRQPRHTRVGCEGAGRGSPSTQPDGPHSRGGCQPGCLSQSCCRTQLWRPACPHRNRSVSKTRSIGLRCSNFLPAPAQRTRGNRWQTFFYNAPASAGFNSRTPRTLIPHTSHADRRPVAWMTATCLPSAAPLDPG
jgi:hypothetical protein